MNLLPNNAINDISALNSRIEKYKNYITRSTSKKITELVQIK